VGAEALDHASSGVNVTGQKSADYFLHPPIGALRTPFLYLRHPPPVIGGSVHPHSSSNSATWKHRRGQVPYIGRPLRQYDVFVSSCTPMHHILGVKSRLGGAGKKQAGMRPGDRTMWHSAVGWIVTLTLGFLARAARGRCAAVSESRHDWVSLLGRECSLGGGVPPGAAGPWLRRG
jgi:hypothetical protein